MTITKGAAFERIRLELDFIAVTAREGAILAEGQKLRRRALHDLRRQITLAVQDLNNLKWHIE
jgi:hypothetical protein